MGCVDWSAVAPDWGRLADGVELMKAALTDELVTGLGSLAGAQILELGSGTGLLAARLADAVGPDGYVVASDVASGMVELERERLVGRANVAVRRLDAQAIAEPDASFDVVVFRMGLMLVPDPDAALEEMRRVLRPGGRLAVAVWGPPQDNPWLTALGMAAMMHGAVSGGPPVGPGTPFSLADPDDLEKRLRNAGFGHVRVTSVRSERRFASTDEHFGMVSVLAPPLAAALAAAPLELTARVRVSFDGLVQAYRRDDGLHLPVHALLGIAHL